MKRYAEADLRQVGMDLLAACDTPSSEAQLVVDHLVEMVEKKAEAIEAALLDANDDPAEADEGMKSAKSIATTS